MDKEQLDKIGKACFVASCKGYIGSFDTDGTQVRQTLQSPDGHKIVGEYKSNKMEAIESCAMQFLQSTHDTATG